MWYPDELIEQIKEENDIVEVVSEYVNLTKKGRTYFGNCPFHNEKTPSFAVTSDKQIFNCFGCHKAGNVINFISQIEGLGFVDAIRFLAKRKNIPLPEIKDEKLRKEELFKQKCIEVNQEALKYFIQALFLPTGKIAQDYVIKRQITKQMLQELYIGYSDNPNLSLYDYLKSKGFEDKEILETSLVFKDPNGRYVSRYKERLMFPILDVRSNVIGFGGRRLDDSQTMYAKYVNSNENVCYQKGNNLYCLNIAKKHAENGIILVEGYMDALSILKIGMQNVVAGLGTALTKRQANLLSYYTKKVYLAYDQDDAGTAAAKKAIEHLVPLGLDVRVVRFDGAKDPDEYISKFGKIEFEKALQNSMSHVEFLVYLKTKAFDLTDTQQKARFIKEVMEILKTLTNEVEKSLYATEIAKKYGISEQMMLLEIQKQNNTLKKEASFETFEKNVQKQKDKEQKKLENLNIHKKEHQEECQLILAIVYSNSALQYAMAHISPNLMLSPKNKEVLETIYDVYYEYSKKIEKMQSNESEGDKEDKKGKENISVENLLSFEGKEKELEYIASLKTDSMYKVEYTKQEILRIFNIFKKRQLNIEKDEILEILKDTTIDPIAKEELEKRLLQITSQLVKLNNI